MKNFQELKIFMKKITIGKDYFLVFEKMILGIISHSAFMWINALYSCFLGVARHLCITKALAYINFSAICTSFVLQELLCC